MPEINTVCAAVSIGGRGTWVVAVNLYRTTPARTGGTVAYIKHAGMPRAPIWLRLVTARFSQQGRLNQWAHCARAQGPGFFFLFEGPRTGCGEIIF